MKSRNLVLLAALTASATSITLAARQADTPQMSETFFKDIRVLKGIPVDEFIDTMGMFSAATAKDCTGCH